MALKTLLKNMQRRRLILYSKHKYEKLDVVVHIP